MNNLSVIDLTPYITYQQCGGSILSFQSLVERISLTLSENRHTYFVFTDVSEGRVYLEHEQLFLEKLQTTLKYLGIDYYIVLDSEYESYSQIKDIDKLVYVDFLVITSYYCGLTYSDQKINSQWNDSTEKGLWTPGAMDRPHRILLLGKLWEKNMLDKVLWSFYKVNSVLPSLRQYLENFDNKTFDQFLTDTVKSLDLDFSGDGKLQFIGYPFDVKLYEQTCFSIITESDFSGKLPDNPVNLFLPKFTEKTYRAIINHHPFIHCWYPGILAKLKSKGYRTFENFTHYPNYNEIIDLDERIEVFTQIVDNFAERLRDCKEEVHKDVNYNFDLFTQNFEREHSKFAFLIDKNFSVKSIVNAIFLRTAKIQNGNIKVCF